MTEETLQKAVEIKKSLDAQREYKEILDDIVNSFSILDDFKLKVKACGKTYERNVNISCEVAKMALFKEIENTISKIKVLEEELAGMH